MQNHDDATMTTLLRAGDGDRPARWDAWSTAADRIYWDGLTDLQRLAYTALRDHGFSPNVVKRELAKLTEQHNDDSNVVQYGTSTREAN